MHVIGNVRGGIGDIKGGVGHDRAGVIRNCPENGSVCSALAKHEARGRNQQESEQQESEQKDASRRGHSISPGDAYVSWSLAATLIQFCRTLPRAPDGCRRLLGRDTPTAPHASSSRNPETERVSQ